MDELVVVGGLVPSLLIGQQTQPEDTQAHVGTLDIDVGLALTLFDGHRYRTLTERLRGAGLAMDTNDDGKPTRQRWKIAHSGKVTVNFLIQPSMDIDKGGKLRDIENDFAAVIAPGLKLAFQDRMRATIEGYTIFGEKAKRDIWVCGPGAFIVLKAFAFDGRGENKDAYDLYYVIRNYGAGVDDVAARLRPLLSNADAQKAISILRRDFLDQDGVGPRRVAEFLVGSSDEDIQADVVGFVRQLIDKCGETSL